MDSSSKKDFTGKEKGLQQQNRKLKTVMPTGILILILVVLLIGIYVLDSYIE